MNENYILQPEDLKVSLYQHQLVSIARMEKLEKDKKVVSGKTVKETRIGINSDKMGYGKTLSMIGLILRDQMDWDLQTSFTTEKVTIKGSGLVKTVETNHHDRICTNLVLASASILSQWSDEFTKTRLKVAVISSARTIETTNPEEYDVFLVVPSMFNKLMMCHSRKVWKRFIFDEPGHVRVPAMRRVEAGFYWFVTSTPYNMICYHKNCKESFMREICSALFDSSSSEMDIDGMRIENTEEFVQESFKMPETLYVTHECYQPISNTIKGIVSPDVKSMVDAGDIQGAVEALGGGRTCNLLDLVKTRKAEELEMAILRLNLYTTRKDQKKMSKWATRKEEIVRHIDEIDRRFSQITSNACNICLDKLEKPVLEPGCQNIFCGKCLFAWLEKNNKCPLCRQVVDTSELIYIQDGEGATFERKLKTKQETIMEIISAKPKGKFLIYSAYSHTFSMVKSSAEDSKISVGNVYGSIKNRAKTLKDFKSGALNVMFLNSSSDAAGLDLRETTDIIIYHEVSSCNESQIIGRANRIGRTESLILHRLKVHI
jgi:SNF2 family DNA or RNA helicase